MKENEIFKDLFVLELANNHWGKLDRGLRIVDQFAQVIRFNNVKAAIKLQFRDVDHFIHKDFRDRSDIRYIKKTLDTQLPWDNYAKIISHIRQNSCLAMATPFDEYSVDMCVKFDLPIIKIASSDLNDWILIEKIAQTRKPCIVSTGGSSQKDLDDIVSFFKKRQLPLAINHCVSIYPSEDSELELAQIDFLKDRYPDNVIGFSTHEYQSWDLSIAIAYAKGARLFERHIDIDDGSHPVSPYCSKPDDVDKWFKSYKKSKEMCGTANNCRRLITPKETKYLDHLVRGVYAKKSLKKGHKLHDADVYLAIPLQKGQISCREFMRGEVLIRDLEPHDKICIDDIDSPYSKLESLRQIIQSRGI